MYCIRKTIHSNLINILVIALIIVLAFYSKLSIAELSSFTANYTLKSLGITQANATNTLSFDGHHYRFESHIKPVGWIEVINKADRYEYSEGLIENNSVTPEKYYYQHSDRLNTNRHVEVIFDKKKQQITNFHQHINNKWKMKSIAQVQDRLSSQLALILALQQSGNIEDKQKFIFSIADGGRLKIYFFTILAEEKLQTPLGILNTIKLEHHRSHQEEMMTIWCAEEFAYIPVKILQQQSGLPDYISIIDSYQKD